MDQPGVKRRLTCILATDAVGYSRLVSENEASALRVLAAHRAVIDGIIGFHEGRIVSTAGDSVLAEFRSVVDAVRCAVEIQDALKTRNESLDESQRMLFRVGINLGEVVVRGDDLLGDGVNVAARLEGAAQPGGILISSSVYDQITGKLDLGFEDMGEQALKNISRPIRAFRISGAGRGLSSAARAKEATSGRKRALAGAISAVALLAVAAGVSWQQGWIGAPRSTDERIATTDAAKAKLEADLAASEKARVQAELRATTSDADAIRARASADAAALRSKAETEAANTKANARSEADALRGKAIQEATRSKASDTASAKMNADADIAATQAKAAQQAAAAKSAQEAGAAKAAQDTAAAKAAQDTAVAKAAQDTAVAKAAQDTAAAKVAASAAADASRHDGLWVIKQQCSANRHAPAFTRTADFVVRGGEFTIERGVWGQPGYNVMRGRPAANGTLLLTGNGIGNHGRGTGQPFEIRLDGRLTVDRYVMSGEWGERTCQAEVARR